jgi:hypothetical protein
MWTHLLPLIAGGVGNRQKYSISGKKRQYLSLWLFETICFALPKHRLSGLWQISDLPQSLFLALYHLQFFKNRIK